MSIRSGRTLWRSRPADCARLAASRREIKVALLDQRVLAGIGNIYASEILHRAGIHPRTPCDRLRPGQWTKLHAEMGNVLRKRSAIRARRCRTRSTTPRAAGREDTGAGSISVTLSRASAAVVARSCGSCRRSDPRFSAPHASLPQRASTIPQEHRDEVLVAGRLLLLCVGWDCGGRATEIIPAERLADWRPGVTVGVPGGIPTNRTQLIDVTKAAVPRRQQRPADAQPAIAKAIGDAKDNQVVYLPSGTYRVNAGITVYGGKSRITIRGDGPDKTILMGYQPTGSVIGITPADGGDWWYPNRLKLDIAGSPKKGELCWR